METATEIPILHVPALGGDPTSGLDSGAVDVSWSPVEIPGGRRPSPTTIAVVATLAGIGAMVLGAAAVITAGGTSSEKTTTVVEHAPPPAVPGAERAALTLLAKPSTRRVVFANSGGRLLLAVGSAGRAAILFRGLEQAVHGRPYYAWVIEPGVRPIRAARFVGTERAVFLSVPLGPKARVSVAAGRPGSPYPRTARIVAARG